MNRRNFNKYILQLLIQGTLSPLFFQIAKNNYERERENYAGENFSEIESQLNNFKIPLPEIELLVPTFWDGIVRICARDGWMYTLG